MLENMSNPTNNSVGWPEFMRFKAFPEIQTGVHEILERNS